MRWFFDTPNMANPAVFPGAENSSQTGSPTEPSEPSADKEMTIAEMADAFGITMRTLRFYEAKELLHPRRIGNRRFYDDACRARLNLVLKGKAMGLGLDEISQLVGLVECDLPDSERAQAVVSMCERQRALLIERREAINTQMAEIDQVIEGLTAL